MRHNRSLPALAAAVLLGTIIDADPARGGPARGWKAFYRYTFDGGRTVGGSPIVIVYDLVTGPGAGRPGCLISARGFQTDDRIVCRTRDDGSSMTVSFHSYGDGRAVNRYGVAVYQPGQTLLALERRQGGTVLTRWDGLRPDLPSNAANPGRYFEPVSR